MDQRRPRLIFDRIADLAVPVGKAEAYTRRHARRGLLPDKHLFPGLNDVAVQVPDVGEVEDHIRSVAAVTSGRAGVQACVVQVGFGDALATEDVIRSEQISAAFRLSPFLSARYTIPEWPHFPCACASKLHLPFFVSD